MSKLRFVFAAAVTGLVGYLVYAIWAKQPRQVQPDELAGLIDRADRVVVCAEPHEGAGVLYESADRRDLDALKEAFRVRRPDGCLHCMCEGSQGVFLYAGGKLVGKVSNQHGKNLRCSLWASDAPLADPEAFLRWFDARGITQPRAAYEADAANRQKRAADSARWHAAAPEALRPLWQQATQSHDPDLAPLKAALASGVPDPQAQVLALYEWYGSGAGPWSGFPSYEDIAERLLLTHSTADLVRAAETDGLTPRQTEGVARLFGGWTFSVRRPADLGMLPADLKSRLLTHSLATGDEDKKARARHAFGAE